MSKPYQHLAWELSYFSGKTRAYLRYKDIPFVERPIHYIQFNILAKRKTGAAVMPIVVTPEGEWMQDTSHIIDRLEQRFPQSPVVPTTPVQKIASYLLELWGDEWWLPVAMWTRWCHPENYPLFLNDAGKGLLPYFPWVIQKRIGAYAAGMMRAHLPGLGIDRFGENTLMERWTIGMLDQLDRHFAKQPYLLGTRPSLGDFGLIGPMYAHLGRDPWSKRELIDPRRNLRAWVDRMMQPQPLSGDFLPNDELPATLDPILRTLCSEVGPWMQATLDAVQRALATLPPGKLLPRGLGTIEFPMAGGTYRRAALPYVLWMLQRIQGVYAAMSPTDQQRVRAWLQPLGGDAMLNLPLPRLRRHGLRVGPEQAV